MSNTDDAKDALNAVAIYLSKLPNASKRFLFVADAIGRFIIHEAPSLDRAFGFTKGRGEYERPEEEAHIVKLVKVLTEYDEGKSWKVSCELAGYPDKNDFHRQWERYSSQAAERFVKEKITPGWDTPLPIKK